MKSTVAIQIRIPAEQVKRLKRQAKEHKVALATWVRMAALSDAAGWEYLEMVREDLESLGIDMKGTPPMMYNDALRHLVGIVGRKAGFTNSAEIREHVREYEAARKLKPAV